MKISKRTLLIGLIGLAVGAAITTAIRFAAYKSDAVHYHANFALYINDERDPFSGPGYYEEVQACVSSAVDNPKTRVHLHDNNPGLVHVHAHGVMWSDLFANLGYGLSDKAVTTPDGVFVDGQDGSKLTYMLNGEAIDSVAGKVISSEDKLLINYGNDSAAVLKKHYDSIPKDAHKANRENDPSACSGSQAVSFTDRLKIALGITPSSASHH